jgi:hypothetical protein
MWLGFWSGEWLGDVGSSPPGSISGVATLHLGTAGAATAKGQILGSVALSLGASGVVGTGEVIPGWVSGVAALSLSTSGALVNPLVIPDQALPRTAPGGSEWDSGQGYVWKGHAWVKATKVARVGISAQYAPRPSAVVRVTGSPSTLRSKVGRGSATAGSFRAPVSASIALTTRGGRSAPNSCPKSQVTSMVVSGYNGACATMGLDEVLALLEMG